MLNILTIGKGWSSRRGASGCRIRFWSGSHKLSLLSPSYSQDASLRLLWEPGTGAQIDP